GLEGLPPASRRRRRLPGGYEKGIHPRARRRGRGPDPSAERSLNAEPLLNSAHAPRAPAQARPDRISFTLRHPPTSARRRDPAGLLSAATALSTRSRRTSMPQNILTERLDAGPVVCAEGFLFELERRGYLTAGEFVPEVAREHPEALRALHVDFQRAGSDIVEAFTYNGHREKMRVIGKEDLLEPLNRSALRIAREVADAEPGNLMAGNISNSNIWDPADPARQSEVRGMFEEMVGWAVEEGADLIIGETFYYAGEALAALEIAKASGLPVVLTLAPMAFQEMADGPGIVETAQRLEQGGADVVGLNCFRGPATLM